MCWNEPPLFKMCEHLRKIQSQDSLVFFPHQKEKVTALSYQFFFFFFSLSSNGNKQVPENCFTSQHAIRATSTHQPSVGDDFTNSLFDRAAYYGHNGVVRNLSLPRLQTNTCKAWTAIHPSLLFLFPGLWTVECHYLCIFYSNCVVVVGFFLACEDFGRMFNNSFPACMLLLLFCFLVEICSNCRLQF